jgi:hypothetical protein
VLALDETASTWVCTLQDAVKKKNIGFFAQPLIVGFSLVEPVHRNSSSRFGIGVCIYMNLIQDYSVLFFQ